MASTRAKHLALGLPDHLQEQYRHIDELFCVNTPKLKQIVGRFEEELRDGLENEMRNISMNPTWVLGFPSGQETGQYLTMDLGGTNLRVCLITLNGPGGETDVKQQKYKLPAEVKTGSAEDLWNLIADSLKTFIDEHGLRDGDRTIPLGFTFSYPVKQDSIDHGTLITWTKGLDIPGVEGENVVAQLNGAIAQRDLPVRFVALVNDTVGAMIASAYNDPETIIGAIFGTGCNAAYMEKVGAISKLKSHGLAPDTLMAINCEYGAFDNSRRVLPVTKYDVVIDRESAKPGEQAFEKMSAGLYLGEIFRLVMLDLHERGLVFRGQDVALLRQRYSLDTEFLAGMENGTLDELRARYQDALGFEPAEDELRLSALLAESIAVRGARLCACGIAAICRLRNIESGHVAADGSVANKHPKFKARWTEALGEVMDWSGDRKRDPIIMTSAEDGSGVGAAVVAAMTMARAKKGDHAGMHDA